MASLFHTSGFRHKKPRRRSARTLSERLTSPLGLSRPEVMGGGGSQTHIFVFSGLCLLEVTLQYIPHCVTSDWKGGAESLFTESSRSHCFAERGPGIRTSILFPKQKLVGIVPECTWSVSDWAFSPRVETCLLICDDVWIHKPSGLRNKLPFQC